MQGKLKDTKGAIRRRKS